MEYKSIRQLIDDAKVTEHAMNTAVSMVQTPDGWVPVERRNVNEPRGESADIDPSRVKVADSSNRELIAMLVAQLIDIRAQKRELDDRDATIKSLLQDIAGELEFVALDEGEKPLLSLKHEYSVRIKSAAVKEQFPPDEFPDLYSQSSSRPLRLM